MALVERTTIRARGIELAVRSVREAEAEPFLAFCKHLAGDTDQLLTQPDEYPDLEGERAFIRAHERHDGGVLLVAQAGERPIAVSGLHQGSRRRNAHTAELGIMVEREWRGRGVGRALIEFVLDWARANPVLERVTLGVWSSNRGAIELYRSMGFVEEGRQRGQGRIEGIGLVDNIMMARSVKPVTAP